MAQTTPALGTGPMLWVGGNPGSGKSTLVRQLAHELDLPLHPVDAYTYDHLDRLGELGPALDEVLGWGPDAAADEFERVSALRLPVVVDDVRGAAVGEVPTLVEGPQLHPDAVAPGVPSGSIWLVTTPERTRAAREGRLATEGEAARRQVHLLVERDRVLGARLRAAAARHGLPLVDVPTDVSWDEVASAVRAAVLAALEGRLRLRPGPELSDWRRHENEVVHRQITAHERTVGAALPAFPYACTCGRSGCDDVESLTVGGVPLTLAQRGGRTPATRAQTRRPHLCGETPTPPRTVPPRQRPGPGPRPSPCGDETAPRLRGWLPRGLERGRRPLGLGIRHRRQRRRGAVLPAPCGAVEIMCSSYFPA